MNRFFWMRLFFTVFLYVSGIAAVCLALFPGVWTMMAVWPLLPQAPAARAFFFCFSAAAVYFSYGFCFILISGVLCRAFRLTLEEGDFPLYSPQAFRWALVNSFFLVLSATFMDFILLTPFMNLFYRLMGAKMGRNVLINSKNCSDLSLLEIGEGAVIGGHATVIGHSFENGRIILGKVKIGRNAVIGLNAVVLPGCEVGEGAVIAAGAVLPKGTWVPPYSVYTGVLSA